MCGIAGIFHYQADEPVPAPVVRRMCTAITHRGPDDEGYYCQGPVGLGARRLSIIDLETGHQPLANEDETVWVVFNGEIYNFAELRQELEQQGHRFRTRTDTEVIVHLYEELGTACVERLRGMFVLAVWDARRRQLFLARDRLGIKPLYYAAQPHRFMFGSELKCLLQVPDWSPSIDLEALSHYVSLSYVPEPLSIFAGVSKLPPGHWLLVRPGRVQLQQYWELPWPERNGHERKLSEEQCAEEIRTLFAESIRLHRVSDVPLGAFLSGGIDSSTVVAVLSRLSDRPVKTFSIGFPQPGFNELEHARRVAQRLGTDHHELIVQPQAIGLVEQLTAYFDEPFGDVSALPTFLLAQLARRSVTVALSGDGGDELFAGYSHYLEARRQQVFDLLPPPLRRHLLRPLSERLPRGMYGKNYLRHIALESGWDRLLNSLTLPLPLKQELLTPEVQAQVKSLDTGAFLEQALGTQDGFSPLERALYLDTKMGLPGDMLTKVDRMSMAHSLEVRVPFLDHVFVEYVARLPLRFKLRGFTTKYILKKAFRDWLPAETLARPKMGFDVPLRHWFRRELRDYLQDVLLGSRAAGRGYFRMESVRSLVGEHLRGRRDHSRLLWSLLALEIWHRHAGR